MKQFITGTYITFLSLWVALESSWGAYWRFTIKSLISITRVFFRFALTLRIRIWFKISGILSSFANSFKIGFDIHLQNLGIMPFLQYRLLLEANGSCLSFILFLNCNLRFWEWLEDSAFLYIFAFIVLDWLNHLKGPSIVFNKVFIECSLNSLLTRDFNYNHFFNRRIDALFRIPEVNLDIPEIKQGDVYSVL